LSKILLFGGSFDPIHNGHLIVCRYAAERLGVDRVVLIPGASPPHKQHLTLTPADVRLQLCRSAVQDDPMFEVSGWETEQTGPNYTLLTVKHFQQAGASGDVLYWLIGLDSLAELPTWYRVGELAKLCKLVTVGRPGSHRPGRELLSACLSSDQIDELESHYLDSPLIEISATDIRERVRTDRDIRYLVPEAVREAIASAGLYRN